MRTLSIVSLALALLLSGCNKDDGPEFTSPEGDWTYTTADGKISVDFTVVKSGNNFDAEAKAMSVDGVSCESIVQAASVTATSIGSIRINANDSKVTYDYVILFTDISISSDFKEMKVPGGSYTWPIDKTNQLKDITISRK